MDRGKSGKNPENGTYRITLTGQLQANFKREEVIEGLARLFKTDLSRVEKIMDQAPVVIQRKLTREKGKKYLAKVNEAGALCTIQAENQTMIPPMEHEPVTSPLQTLYQPPVSQADQEPSPTPEVKKLQTLDPPAWQSLAIGSGITLVVVIIPFLSFIFHYMITLVHELGHAIFGWIFGYPSLPAFDFVYGGGITMYQNQKSLIILLVFILLAGMLILFRRNHLTILVLILIVAGYTLAVFSSFHQFIILFMGHGSELIFAGIFLYRALSGSSIIVAVERPLYAFLAFFILFKGFRFAFQLYSSPAHRQMYAAAKGGGHWMDFSRIARDFLGIELSSVAGLFFLICLLVVPATYFIFRHKRRLFQFLTRILNLTP